MNVVYEGFNQSEQGLNLHVLYGTYISLRLAINRLDLSTSNAWE
jgi:hypothetical protein